MSYLEQITYVVKYLHDNEVVHGQLTSKNVFVDSNNRLKVGDFCESRFTKSEGDKTDDIFALGVIALELCKIVDAKGVAQKISGGDISALSLLIMSTEMKALIGKMTDADFG